MVLIITVRLPLAVIPIKFVKSHFVGSRHRTRIPQSPFTENPRCISCRFHKPAQCICRCLHGLLSLRLYLFITSYLWVSCMQSRHKRTTGRRTYRASGIMLGKQHTLLCHSVYVGSLYFILSITAYISVTEVVGKNINDIDRVFTMFLSFEKCSICD